MNGWSWSPAQLVAIVLGVIFIVLGGVALLRAGAGMDLLSPVVVVAGLAYTPLLAIIELVIGLLLLAVGAFPGATDAVVFIGVLLLAFGLVLVIEPGAFERTLAAGRPHGWFYVITGGIAALTGLLTPVLAGRGLGSGVYQRREVERTVDEPAQRSYERDRTSRTSETRRIDED